MRRMIRTLAKPITVPVAACVGRVARMDEPLKRHIDAAEATGDDVCAQVWREYVSWQVKLLPYRWHKLQMELDQLTSGKMPISELTFSDFILFAKFATTCLFLFLVGVMVGRRSVFPSIQPGSPFTEEIVKNWHVNQINALPNDPRESIHFLLVNNEQFPEDLTEVIERNEQEQAQKKARRGAPAV